LDDTKSKNKQVELQQTESLCTSKEIINIMKREIPDKDFLPIIYKELTHSTTTTAMLIKKDANYLKLTR
jgi:hypothetical protein